MIVYILYAEGDIYVDKAEREIIPYMKFFFDNIILYKKEDIDSNFYINNKKILDCSRGAGYWLWKPYFVLKTLHYLSDGDIVFYLDVGDYMRKNIKEYLIENIKINDGFFLVQNTHNHSVWTKKDCFILMNCNNDFYLNKNQLEAGCCAFMKTDKVIVFLNDWLKYCQNYDIISDKIITNNYPQFRDHRHDQSILTNIQIKNNINTVPIINVMDYIIFNYYTF